MSNAAREDFRSLEATPFPHFLTPSTSSAACFPADFFLAIKKKMLDNPGAFRPKRFNDYAKRRGHLTGY